MSLFTLVEQGGPTLIPLGVGSVLVIAVILERIWTYSRLRALPQDLLNNVARLLSAGDRQAAYELLHSISNPYARIAQAGLASDGGDKQEIIDMLTIACDAEIESANRPLPILATIGNIAPFIGLLGTVIGIMRAFTDVAHKEAYGASVVSAGIAEALIATAAGLAVGIVAVVANNWCHAWVERYRISLESFATRWAYRILDANRTTEVQETEPVA